MFLDLLDGLTDQVAYLMLTHAASHMIEPRRLEHVCLGYFMGVAILARPQDTLFNLMECGRWLLSVCLGWSGYPVR
jgi:hypothetical protein